MRERMSRRSKQLSLGVEPIQNTNPFLYFSGNMPGEGARTPRYWRPEDSF